MAPMVRMRQSISKDRFPLYFGSLRTQAYHDPGVRGALSHQLRSIAWNPLGTLIATGSVDTTLRVWNPERPTVRHTTELKGHVAAIEKVAFNPVKGELFLPMGEEAELSMAEPSFCEFFNEKFMRVSVMAIADLSSQTLDAELCSVSSDGVVKFWDVRTKAIINEVEGLGDAFTLAWNPDGETLVVGNKMDKLFVLSPTQSTPIASHQQTVQTNQITFDHSGTKIFLTTGEGRIKILSYPEFKPVFTSNYDPSTPFSLNGHTSSCLSVELQPTARYLASGGSDSIIALWDTTDWICQRTLIDMTGPVRSISFSYDGSYIVGGSDEGNGLEIAHTETGEYVYSVKSSNACPLVAWHPNRYSLAYTDMGSLKIIGVDPERK